MVKKDGAPFFSRAPFPLRIFGLQKFSDVPAPTPQNYPRSLGLGSGPRAEKKNTTGSIIMGGGFAICKNNVESFLSYPDQHCLPCIAAFFSLFFLILLYHSFLALILDGTVSPNLIELIGIGFDLEHTSCATSAVIDLKNSKMKLFVFQKKNDVQYLHITS